ncbi:MAG TPA: GDP-mannose 4,6-dehydratase, partial [Thermodesulfobacteriota bacterium]|nr:GDP-mannose 4,6-dehydratase [Thermodesulfobacteriota bacterium]
IAVFLGSAKEGKPITIWGKGDITRDYLYIKDSVPVLINAVQTNNQQRLFNLGSGKGTTLNELIAVIKKVTGRTIKVTYTGQRVIDVPINVLEISRVREEFGFSPKTTLLEGVKKTWQWLNRS